MHVCARAYTDIVTHTQEATMLNDRDWQLTSQHAGVLVRAGYLSAVLCAADEADGDWELYDDLNFNVPFDPYADDPE